MALIVEDGTGKVDAESYGSTAEATTYHAKLGNDAWAQITEDRQEICLRKATDYMVMTLRGLWMGWRTVDNQALDHPRIDLWRDDRDMVPSNEVAKEVKACCFELALIANTTPLMPTGETRSKYVSVKVGPIAVTYDNTADTATAFVAAMRRLAPFLSAQAGSGTVSLVRC